MQPTKFSLLNAEIRDNWITVRQLKIQKNICVGCLIVPLLYDTTCDYLQGTCPWGLRGLDILSNTYT